MTDDPPSSRWSVARSQVATDPDTGASYVVLDIRDGDTGALVPIPLSGPQAKEVGRNLIEDGYSVEARNAARRSPGAAP